LDNDRAIHSPPRLS